MGGRQMLDGVNQRSKISDRNRDSSACGKGRKGTGELSTGPITRCRAVAQAARSRCRACS